MNYLRLSLYSALVAVAVGGWCDNKQMAGRDLVSAYNRFPSSRVETKYPQESSYPQTRNNLPTEALIKSMGYPAETHYVTTADGYILAMHRIPYGKTNTDTSNRGVVFVQHGLLCSSADWVVSTPEKGLGYMLAEAGYDVWLGNYRGNTYSRNHTFFDPNEGDGGFWDFTWDEMAQYDIPSQIEKVLEITGKDELQYIGHSMGTTAFMAMHHYRPDVASKIRLAHLLSPVAYVGTMQSPIGWIAGLGPLLDAVLGFFGIGEFLPESILMDCLSSLFCHTGITQGICSSILFVLCGFDEPQMNKTLLPDILHHTPAGASTPTILHYAQEVTSNGFHGYDWGSDRENFNHHGSEGVPNYSLADVTTPVAVYWGQNDWMASVLDVAHTLAELPNVVHGMDHMVELPTWNHLDFLWAKDADKYVFADVLANIITCQEKDCRQN